MLLLKVLHNSERHSTAAVHTTNKETKPCVKWSLTRGYKNGQL